MAAVPRFATLGLESFWYDEVIPMRLALTPNPAALMRLLGEIEATRAPLHPLVLQGWVRIFGGSEYAARSLSAVCGWLTVAVVFCLGRRLAGDKAGLWSAALAAVSPSLVIYSLEAKMYAWITLLTCLAWWNLLTMRSGVSRRRFVVQALLIASLVYSQPLGLFMGVALGLGAWIDRGRSGLTTKGWIAIHFGAAAIILPWLPRYLDHPPEFLSDPPTIKLLLGMPIGFTGGNFRMLLILLAVIHIGVVPVSLPWLNPGPRVSGAGPIVAWLVLPPLMLFGYSLLKYPIFGPSRYNVYVAPAYLILVGAGLSRMNVITQIVSGFALGFIAILSMQAGLDSVFTGRKADWKIAAARLDKVAPGAPVIVIAPPGGPNREVEVARYYLGDRRRVIAMPGRRIEDVIFILGPRPGRVFLSVSRRGFQLIGDIPQGLEIEGRNVHYRDFTGLRLYEMQIDPP